MTRTVIKGDFEVEKEVENLSEIFEKAVLKVFSDVNEINHFYYGEYWNAVTVVLNNKHYAKFSITRNRVSFGGHYCSSDECDKFESLTMNDECYVGKLMEISRA